MTSPYDGVQWVGMDLHGRRSVLVRMGSDGRQLGKTVRFNHDPVRLKREIAKHRSAREGGTGGTSRLVLGR
jgi:hypothetical protein